DLSAAGGIPLHLTDGSSVTSISLTLIYDPNLLSIPAALVPGRLDVTFTSTVSLPPGPIDFLTIPAQVPTQARYAALDVLHLVNLHVNGGAIAAQASDGLHLVGYLGDAAGHRSY